MNELEQEIRRRIAAAGPLPFDQFMNLALYHPELGYYSRPRDPFGVHGDYYTNSQVQPVFGRLIAQQILAWEVELGSPPEFTVVELGAGRGETAREVRALLPHIRYIEVEKRSGALPEQMVGVVFSNEFFDALPVEVVEFRPSRLMERRVGLKKDKLAWVERAPCSTRIEDYARRFIPRPAPGQVIEVNLEALDWLERIARSLVRGLVLTIDYGYTAGEIAGGRRFSDGSLMSYSRHTASEDVLRDPGERDITAHVNFTALAEHGASLGLEPSPLQTQTQFLLSIGQADNFASAMTASLEQDTFRHRQLLKTLLFDMGETYQVLIQKKNG
ncbi:MAG: SAM-dependent methyltransferase [Acidobacteria bacterium]|nr:SAM-dependent methyltransferase [Acidobacteriota bacterium]